MKLSYFQIPRNLNRWLTHTPTALLNWVLPILLATVPLATAWLLRTVQQYDDQYITYTYARSLAAGQGFSYNGGWVHLGTTTPGWTLMLAVLAWIFPWLAMPILSHLVCGLCAAITVLLLYRLGHQGGYLFAGLAMAALFAFDPLFPWVMGSEYPLLLMLCTLSLVLVLRRRYELAAVAAGLAMITRYDAAILVGILALWITWQERRLLWRPLLLLALVFGAWLAFAYFTFGSILPGSLSAKQAHGTFGIWPPLDKGFLNWFLATGYYFPRLTLICVGLLAVGLVGVSLHRAAWLLPIMAWGVLYVLFYLEIGVPFYFQYFALAWFTLTVSAAGSVSVLSAWHVATAESPPWRQISVWSVRITTTLAVLAVSVFAAYNYGSNVLHRQLRAPQADLYTKTGQWLKENTRSDAKVGFIEVGYVGFYSERPIMDVLGLVTPEVVPFLRKRDFQGVVARFEPEYYLRNTVQDNWLMTQLIKSSWFQERYVPVHQIEVSGHPGAMVIYRWGESDLLQRADKAQVVAPSQPFPHFERTTFTIQGDTRQVLMLHPPASLSYQLKLSPRATTLAAALAMDPQTWTWGGDGATFIVDVTIAAGEANRLLQTHIGVRPEDRRWHEVQIDLSRYRGQEVAITLKVEPGPNQDFTGDRAGWAGLLILR